MGVHKYNIYDFMSEYLCNNMTVDESKFTRRYN